MTDNIITPEEESGVLENANQSPENENSNKKDALQSTSDTQNADGNAENQEAQTAGANGATTGVLWIVYRPAIHPVDKIPAISAVLAEEPSSSSVTESSDATNITLYRRNPGENVLFFLDNMFPGDADMRYFRVKVSYKNTVNVRYHAQIRKGYEKLAEVLQIRVRLVETDEVLYEGSMKNMPEKINHLLNSTTETTDELCYEILTYLDTSVGNEYMNTKTIVDFRWWVEEVENLISPKTGEYYRMLAIAILAGVSVTGALFFLILKRREEEKDEQK